MPARENTKHSHPQISDLVSKLFPMQTLNKFSTDSLLIAPSLLAADFGHLADELSAIEVGGAEIMHYDVMDGHFVPNISMGVPVCAGIRKYSSLPFDVHLMLTNPRQYVGPFVKAGADHITIHVECDDNIEATLKEIREAGCSCGLSLRPRTPASAIAPYLDMVDLILVMTVEPGFGGQSFMADQVPKIAEIKKMIADSGHPVHLQVDGGIDAKTAPLVTAAGANVLVAGSSVFRNPAGIGEAIKGLKTAN